MNDLIEALQIFQKYMPEDVRCPTHCEHDTLYICCVEPDDVSLEDIDRLKGLGFFVPEEEDCFMSFRFGSC